MPIFGHFLFIIGIHSIDERGPFLISSTYGRVAEWLGTGLQNPLLRFKSGRDLYRIGSVVELVYTADLKSAAFIGLWVRVPPDPHTKIPYSSGIFLCFTVS